MNMPGKPALLALAASVVACALLFACSGPEAKKQKFFAKGKTLYEKGDYVRARLELKNALQIDPRFPEAHDLLGMLELKRGDPQAAFREFGKAAQLNPRDCDAQLQLGELYLSARSLDKAREKVDLVLKEQPRNQAALLLSGAISLADRGAAQALGELLALRRQGITPPRLYLLLATAYRQGKNDAEAEQVLLAGEREHRDSLPLRRALAELYAGSGRVADAAGQIRQLIALKPDDYGFFITLAGLYWDNRDEKKAREILSQLPESAGNREESRLAVARFFLSRTRPAEAEGELRAGIARQRKNFPLRLALSDLYSRTGRPDQAIALLKECLELEKDQAAPHIIDTKNALARLYLERGDLPQTERLLGEISRETPRNLEANLTRGRLYLITGEGEPAVAAFQVVVSDQPRELQGYLLLAEAQQLNQKPGLALESLQQAQKLEPESRELLRALARYYLRQLDFRSAEGYLRKALAKNPQDLEVLVELGDLFRAARDGKRAESAYAQVKRCPGGALLGRIKLSELYQETGRADRAAAEISQALELAPQSEDLFARQIRGYLQRQKTAEATLKCRERISRRPREVVAYCLLSEILALGGDLRGAEQALVQAPRPPGHGTRIDLALAQLLVQQGKLPQAKRLYEALLASQPDSWAAINDFACALGEHGDAGGDLRRARALAQQANSRFPGNPTIMDTLGWICYRAGDFPQAVLLLEKSAQKRSDSPLIRYHAGMALYRTGKLDQARAHLRFAAASPERFQGKEEAIRMAQGAH